MISKKSMDLVEDLTFLPSPEQRKVKAAFWTTYSENPTVDVEYVTVEEAKAITGDWRVTRWWAMSGFREWFLNKEEFRQRLEYLANLALDAAEDILMDRNAHPSARTNMAKLVIEAANRMPNRWAKEKYMDEKIHQMDRAQLEEYIRKAMKQLPVTGGSTPDGREEDS